MPDWVADAAMRDPYVQDVASGGGGGRMAFVAPLIGAGASLGGAALGGKGAKKAAEAQLTANREALAFQREQEAARRAQYDQAMQQYQRQYDAWNANRMALLKRYGVDIGGGEGIGAPGVGTAGPMVGGPMAGPAGAPAAAPMAQVGGTIGEMLGRGRPTGEWSDWSRYGLR